MSPTCSNFSAFAASAARSRTRDRGRGGRLSFVIGRLSFVICHWSFVVCHLSLVVCRLSFVIWHLSKAAFGEGHETKDKRLFPILFLLPPKPGRNLLSRE